MMKILVIRLSSIGDVVLTSPILRAIKNQHPEYEVHYLTKAPFASLVYNSPYVDKVHIYSPTKDMVRELTSEHFNFVVDLQKNHRSKRLCSLLLTRRSSFSKQNLDKFFLVAFKWARRPIRHIVDRYFDAVAPLGIHNDGLGLDFFFSKAEPDVFPFDTGSRPYVVLVVGANHATKTIPPASLQYLACNIKGTVVLLGGKADGQRLKNSNCYFHDNVINLCGKTTLEQSAYIMQQSALVIAPDTGMMHIATALGCQLVVVWGNTTPLLGFSPYQRNDAPQHRVLSMEVDLPCRPCSKLGRDKCPRHHHNCMSHQHWQDLYQYANSILQNK